MATKERLPTDWPHADVRAKWDLLERCLDETGFFLALSPDEQTRAVDLAISQGIGPLLYHQWVKSAAPDRLTGRLSERLQAEYMRTVASHLLLSFQIRPVVEGFTQARIPVLWVKGVVLAETVYPVPALRPSSDLDIIVRSEDFGPAERVIRAVGYQPVFPEAFGNLEPEISHDRRYERIDMKAVTVELHRHLVNDLQGETPDGKIWFRAQTTQLSFNGIRLTTLNPEANLLYLCAHLVSHHGWEPRLIWLYDMKALLEKFGATFDWQLFASLTEKLTWGPYVRAALGAASSLLGVQIPDEIFLKSRGKEEKSSLLDWQKGLPPTPAVRTYVDWLRIGDGRTRFRALWRIFFPTRAYMVYRYAPSHRGLWPFLYPYRWSLMAREGIETLKTLRQRSKA